MIQGSLVWGGDIAGANSGRRTLDLHLTDATNHPGRGAIARRGTPGAGMHVRAAVLRARGGGGWVGRLVRALLLWYAAPRSELGPPAVVLRSLHTRIPLRALPPWCDVRRSAIRNPLRISDLR